MLLSKTILSYERQLKQLIKKDPTNIDSIKRLLKEAVTQCQNEIHTLRYVRLWLYLATLYKNPLDVCLHLLDRNIGTTYALLYQDMAFHYVADDRKDMAESILRQGISRDARPLDHLQQSLMDLGNDDLGSIPPSVKGPLPTTITETEQVELPLFMVGLGSETMHGVLDGMELFIRQMARISLFEESEHYQLSTDEIRAGSSSSLFQVEDVTTCLDPDHPTEQGNASSQSRDLGETSAENQDSFLEHYGTESYDDMSSRHQGKMRDYSPTMEMTEQQQRPTLNRSITIVTFPLTHEYKQSLLESYPPLPSTYELMQPVNLESLSKLKNNTNVSLTLGQETVRMQKILGEGEYGTVYLANWNSDKVAIKIHKEPDRWDHYIHQLIYQECPDADRFFIRSHALYVDPQTSFLLMEYASQGTLLDLLNGFLDDDKPTVPEPLVQLLMLRLLQAILMLHQSHITHNDLKLDNLLLCYTLDDDVNLSPIFKRQATSSSHLTDIDLDHVSVKITDFSLAIHLNLVTPACTSTKVMMKCDNDHHPSASGDSLTQLPAIVSGLPWSPYHLDYWEIANCAHTLLFSAPLIMDGPQKLKRYWNEPVWRRFFDVLAVHPPTTTLEDGIHALQSLISDLTLSLANNARKIDALYHLYSYDRHSKIAH